MDLYEALKGGTSEEELYRLFKKDLTEAKEKLDAERENAEKKAWIEECRNNLAMALSDYIGAVFGDDWIDEDSDDAIAELLESFEKDIKTLEETSSEYLDMLKQEFSPNKSKNKPVSKAVKKPSVKIVTNQSEEDDKIIREFLDSLK